MTYTKDTFEASEVHEIEDDNMSITRSISVAQTDNRVVTANCYVEKPCETGASLFKRTYEATDIRSKRDRRR